jgi:signal recognition particle subunit SRP54
MGSLQDILGMMPGMDASKLGNVQVDEKQMARMEAIILSMTKAERVNPDILNAGRRKRIARGSGTSIQDVNRLLNQYDASRKMMRQLTGAKGKKGRMRMPFPF